jgi:DNA replication protein DnaC
VFRSITKAQLLILDDWGPDRLTVTRRRDLMEIVEERYGRGSTMITSQLPIKAWHDVIGEPTFADAIPDRVRHCARTNGASMAHSTMLTASNSRVSPCGKPSAKWMTKRPRYDS